MPLKEGDRIWVPEEGLAELQTKDGSYLRLADRSALEILTLDRDSYQTYLTEGRLYANFRGSKDSLLQIDTPTSSVRAYERSKFNVDVPERGPVNVSVFQGEVKVENRDGSIGVASGDVLSLGERG
jgi:ferric-dicitrate binding protein FerR (iron transport regulator)